MQESKEAKLTLTGEDPACAEALIEFMYKQEYVRLRTSYEIEWRACYGHRKGAGTQRTARQRSQAIRPGYAAECSKAYCCDKETRPASDKPTSSSSRISNATTCSVPTSPATSSIALLLQYVQPRLRCGTSSLSALVLLRFLQHARYDFLAVMLQSAVRWSASVFTCDFGASCFNRPGCGRRRSIGAF